MTSGRWLVLAIVSITALFAAGMWYAQTRAFYTSFDQFDLAASRPDGSEIALVLETVEGIDATSSPLRFRLCAQTDAGAAALLQEAMLYDAPTPLIAPDWFTCFDAEAITAALASGEANAYLGRRNISRGVDLVLARFSDGRMFAWHQLNGTLE